MLRSAAVHIALLRWLRCQWGMLGHQMPACHILLPGGAPADACPPCCCSHLWLKVTWREELAYKRSMGYL